MEVPELRPAALPGLRYPGGDCRPGAGDARPCRPQPLLRRHRQGAHGARFRVDLRPVAPGGAGDPGELGDARRRRRDAGGDGLGVRVQRVARRRRPPPRRGTVVLGDLLHRGARRRDGCGRDRPRGGCGARARRAGAGAPGAPRHRRRGGHRLGAGRDPPREPALVHRLAAVGGGPRRLRLPSLVGGVAGHRRGSAARARPALGDGARQGAGAGLRAGRGALRRDHRRPPELARDGRLRGARGGPVLPRGAAAAVAHRVPHGRADHRAAPPCARGGGLRVPPGPEGARAPGRRPPRRPRAPPGPSSSGAARGDRARRRGRGGDHRPAGALARD